MPASGGGTVPLRRAPRGTPAPPRKPAPKPPPPAPQPIDLHNTSISKHPFGPALTKANRKVARTQKAIPATPHPHVPLLPNPTPHQTKTALDIVRASQKAAIGPNPTPARLRAYQQEVATNPNLRPFREAIAHYSAAAEKHLREGTAGDVTGHVRGRGAPLLSGPPIPETIKEALEQRVRERERAGQSSSQARASTIQGVQAASASKQAAGALGPIGEGLGNLVLGTGKALVNDPGATLSHTVEQVPDIFRQVGISYAKLIGESATGHPVKAAKEFVGGTLDTAKGLLGQSLAESQKEAEDEGAANKLLLALGGQALAGRGLSSLARAVGKPEAEGLRGRLGRTGGARPPIALTKEAALAKRPSGVKQRDYSPDIFREAVQVALDKRRQPVRDAEQNVVMDTSRLRPLPVLAPRELKIGPARLRSREARRLQQQRANMITSGVRAEEQLGKEEIARLHHKLEREGKIPRSRLKGTLAKELVSLAVEGRILTKETAKADLEREAANAERTANAPEGTHTADEVKAARENAAIFREAAENPKIVEQLGKIVEQGERHTTQLLAPGERGIEQHNIRPATEMERARLGPVAVAQLGAKRYEVADHLAAEKRAKAEGRSQEYIDSVSGRNPRQLARYRQARAGVKQARASLSAAHDALYRARKVRDRQVGVHASRRGSQGLRAATDEEKAISAANKERVKTAEADVRAAKAELKAAEAHIQKAHNRKPKPKAALRYPEGQFLPGEDIIKVIEDAGRDPRTIGYLPHTIGTGRKGAFHQAFHPGRRPSNTAPGTRTFALQQRGVTAFGRELMREEATSKSTLTNLARGWDRVVHEFGVRHPDGRYFTPKEAEEWSRTFAKEGKGEWVAVRAFGGSLPGEVQQILREDQSPAAMETAHLALLKAMKGPGKASVKGSQNMVLAPLHLINQIEEHARPAGTLERMAQQFNGLFRRAVLTQPRWLTGNFLEPYVIRLPLSGAGVNIPGLYFDIKAANKTLRAMERSGDPEQKAQARRIRAQQEGGQFLGKRGAIIVRNHLDNPDSQIYASAHWIRNAPPVKQLGDLVVSFTDAYFRINHQIEVSTQKQAFGRSVRRDIQRFSGSWWKSIQLADDAVKDAGKGLTNSAAQHRYLDSMHELLGQYDSFDPRLRKTIQTVAPFLPWTLASMRFIFWTLPAHHTVAFTSLALANENVMREWEAAHDFISPAAKKGTLGDALVRRDQGLVDILRYTPMGATTPILRGNFENATDTLLPQISGALEALKGKDPFGQPLQVAKSLSNPEGEPRGLDKGEAVLEQVLEAVFPFIAQARRLQEKGGTAYGNSTFFNPKVKPGTSHGRSAVSRTYNPFNPVYMTASGAEPPPLPTPPTSTRLGPRQQTRVATGALRSSGPGPRQRARAAR